MEQLLLSIKDINFKEVRKSKRLTLMQVEKELGISNSYLSQLENKKIKNPSWECIRRLVNFYKINYLIYSDYWISIKKTLPEKGNRVLVYSKDGECVISRLEKNSDNVLTWIDDDFNTFALESILFYQLLPKPPKEY